MTRLCPIKPIYLAFILVLLNLAILSPSFLSLGLLGLVISALLCQYDQSRIGQVLIILLAFGTYFFWGRVQTERQLQIAPKDVHQLTLLPDSLSVNGDLVSFRATEANQTYQVFYKAQSEAEKSYFQTVTDRLMIEVEAELEIPEGQRNFSGFDYQAYLKNQGIYQIAKVNQIKSVTVDRSWSVSAALSQLRRLAIVHIKRTFPAPMKHYMTGLLLGYLDKEFAEMSDLYSSLGIIHLFALSGMQVGFFITLFRKGLLRLGLRLEQVLWLQLPFSLLYAGLTGFSVSVIRSLIQAFFSRLGIKALDNLALTLALCLILMPRMLLTTGGVLSFAYAFVIAMLGKTNLTGFRASLWQSLSLSVVILPFLLYYFASFQPFSIVLTAFFSLAFDYAILPALTLAFVLSPLLPLTFLNSAFECLEWLLNGTAHLLGKTWVFGSPSLIIFIILLGVLGLLADRWRQKKPYGPLIVVLLSLVSLVKHPLDNEVTILDIGQGDSIFLRDMWGKTLLIDVGGRVTFGSKEAWQERVSSSNAEKTSIPYLKSRGVTRIDYLVLTHADADHIGDMEMVAEHFDIGQIWISQGALSQESFVNRLKDMKLPVKTVTAGDQLSIMGSQLVVLYPWQAGDGKNDDSIVLYGKLLGTRFLFTGDLEEAGERQVLTAYPDLQVDVLKVGHHGSKGSSSPDFLKHLSPKVALISAGQKNRYQHPHQETLDRFWEQGIAVYRTDLQGAIRLRGWQSFHLETVRHLTEADNPYQKE